MRRLVSVLTWLLVSVRVAQAYVDISPSLGAIIQEAESITVVEVDKVSQEKQIVILKKVRDLKGETPAANLRQHVEHGYHPREPKLIMDWAQPGQTAIVFQTGRSSIVCIGQYWYQVTASQDGWWTLVSGRPELSLAYFGYIERLGAAIPKILDQQEVVVTVVDHGARFGVYQYENVAFQKVLRGRECPVCRVKASLKMPRKVWQVSDKDSPWVVGPGAAGVADLPGLIKDLESDDVGKRVRSADDLGLVGGRAAPALTALYHAYEDPDANVRVSAARAVALINEEVRGPLKVLSAALGDERAAVRKNVAAALGDISEAALQAVPHLAKALRDPDQGVRWNAAEALSRIGPGAEAAIPALALALKDPTIRVMAADALGSMGVASRGAVPLLIDALGDKDQDYRWTSAIALSRIDPASAKAAMPMFIERLTSPDLRARWDAMMFVTPMGLEAKEAATAVREIVKHGNGVGATTLAAIAGPDAEDAMPLLLHVLADDWDTSDSIAKIGAKAVPYLLKALEDDKSTVCDLQIKALGLISADSREAVLALVKELKEGDNEIRKVAATALALSDTTEDVAIRALQTALEDGDPQVRLASASALRALGNEGIQRINRVVVDLLGHGKADVRAAAAAALADFGAIGFSQATVLLDEAIKDNDPHVRSEASRTLAKVAAAHYNGLAVDEMIAELKAKDPQLRVEAAKFLGSLGRDARNALDALFEAKQDENQDVREAAAMATWAIKGRHGKSP